MTDPIDMVDRLAEALLYACDAPELLETHGLPVPTPDRCRRALRGYVARHQEFPATRNVFEPLSMLLGIDRIRTERARFAFAEHGELGEIAVIQPVTATGEPGDREPIDLVAWHPDRPGRWWMLSGTAEHLGPWPASGDARLAEHPLAWLADPDRLCLLTFSRGMLTRLLDLHHITITDRVFGQRLYSELRDLALPKFEIAP
ncbi:MAG: hypothetical protein WAS21_03660 [Geminicoccaceae bacterium]